MRYGGMTIQVPVADVAAARGFYGRLFGREPDFAPHEDFLEWQVVPGAEVWLQVVGVTDAAHRLTSRLRLRVDDVEATTAWAAEHVDVRCAPVTSLPGVVAFTDFADPWGNPLGFYQDLAPSGSAPGPGGSAHDESRFRPGVVR